MALYFYQAFSKQGKRVSGSLDGTSKKDVQDKLTSQGLFPVTIQLSSDVQAQRFSFKRFFERSVSIKDKIFFTKQLGILLKSGVPLVEALNLLSDQSEGTLRSIVISLRDGIKEGKSLAEGLAHYPKTFEVLYVQLVKAGEASGKLEVILERLTDYLERRDELRRKVKSALTYPLIQLAVIGVAVLVLITFVVPQIADIFAKQDAELPLPTKILIGISDFFKTYYIVIFVGVIFFYGAYRVWRATPRGAYIIDSIKLKIPIVKYFTRTSAVVQFCSTLGMLLAGGVRLSEALDIVANIVDNRVLVDALMKARENIIKQGRVAEYLKQTALFPPVAIYLIKTGEQSGHLDEMLMTVAQYYETELREYSDGLASKLNPIMLLIMAVIVGFIVVAIMLPLTSIGNIVGSQV